MGKNAKKPLTFDEVSRRAGGRRKYNRERHAHAAMRRLLLLMDLDRRGFFFGPGQIARWAVEHQVSTATIYRDLRRLRVRELQQLRLTIRQAVEARAVREWERRDRWLGRLKAQPEPTAQELGSLIEAG
jgi:DNA-binding MurR/RpiR family transcriptional regulator